MSYFRRPEEFYRRTRWTYPGKAISRRPHSQSLLKATTLFSRKEGQSTMDRQEPGDVNKHYEKQSAEKTLFTDLRGKHDRKAGLCSPR